MHPFKEIYLKLRVVLLFFAFVLFSTCCLLLFKIVLGYAEFKNDVQFLVHKQEYIDIMLWKLCFYIHVFSAIASLFIGASQFFNNYSCKGTKWHKYFGRIYVWNILFVNVPCGVVLAIYANGGLAGKSAFICLDTLWFYFTYIAYHDAKNKRYQSHVINMIRSYSLTFSAITLRGWHLILVNLFPKLDYNSTYILEAWLGFVPNILIAELLIKAKLSSEVRGHN